MLDDVGCVNVLVMVLDAECVFCSEGVCSDVVCICETGGNLSL